MNNEKAEKSKKLRGMTLFEVVISIAVLAIMSLLLAVVGQTIEKYRRYTKEVNQKVVDESPLAESRTSKFLIDDNYEVVVSKGVVDGGVAKNKKITLTGKLYDTGDAAEVLDGSGNPIYNSKGEQLYTASDGVNFKYVVIENQDPLAVKKELEEIP